MASESENEFFKVSFFYLEDRGVCDHYVSMTSESETEKRRSNSKIETPR